MNNFLELNLPPELLTALEKMEFTTPTPIQALAIPFALQGRDILGSAQTGTGKTAAFGIPLVAHLINSPGSAALIMTPTRELAVQIVQMIKKLIGANSPIKTALLIGGENMFRQFSQLEQGPRLIVGTPGRINDHLSRKSLKLGNVDFLVLDETDRMLDMGFGVQIDKILTYMPGKRQTLMFSATLPSHIVRLSEKYMRDAERVSAGSTTTPIRAIKQEVVRVAQAQKYESLTAQLDARSGSIIVFVRTKHGADRLAHKLDRENHSADAIHGDLRQNKRDKVIRMFREQKTRILVATDVAARGLDIPHIEHVINYDLPQCPEDYIHRIGRTARAGAEGSALCLVSPEENGKWAAIERLMNGGEGSSEPYQKKGKPGGRNRGGNGFGRKNEGFNEQRSKRKPHRKGQSWQVAHDERKANAVEAGPVPASHAALPAGQKFERKFERRDEKQNFRGGRQDKPWQKKREGGSDRPYQKREGASERPNDRPYVKRERSEGGSDRPWQKKREGGDKPWQKKREGGSDRPYQKREEGSSNRPNDRPYVKRERSEEGGKKHFSGKPKSAGFKPAWQGKKSGDKNRDGNRPFRRDRNAA